MRTLCCQGWVNEESKYAQTIVDGDEYHILGTPFLSVELRLRAPSLTKTATMNLQSHR